MREERKAIAVYRPQLSGEWWDVREAKPRCRVKLKDGVKSGPILTVWEDDRSIEFDADALEVDYYEGEQFKNIREEVVV
jgi:hypothetical protein